MKHQKNKSRIRLYLILNFSLYFFSQIVFSWFASYALFAYILASLNGVLAIEIYFWLKRIKGKSFVAVFMALYGSRLFILLLSVFVYVVASRESSRGFLLVFFANYYVWLMTEVYVLLTYKKETKKNAFARSR